MVPSLLWVLIIAPDDRAAEEVEGEATGSELRSARAVRLTIVGFSAVLLLTIIASIHLSTLDVSFGSMLFGSRTVWRGQSAAFRLSAYDPRGVDLVGPLTATFALVDQRGRRAEVTNRGGALVEARLAVPDDLDPATAALVVAVETPLGQDQIQVDLVAVDEPPALEGQLAPHTEVYPLGRRPTGPYQVAIYPRGGHVVGGLENLLAGRITANDRPVKTELHTDAFGIHTASDGDGLLRFPFLPLPQAKNLSFAIGESESEEIRIPLEVVSAGLLLEVLPRGLVEPGDGLRLTVRSLPFADRTVHLDVWAGNSLLLAASQASHNGVLEVEIGLPQAVSGFVRVEAYRNLGVDEESRSTQLLWASEETPERAALAALDALANLEGSDPILEVARRATGPARIEMTKMALTRYRPPRAGPPMIASTLGKRQDAVSARKEAARTVVHTLFILTIVTGLGLAVGRLLRHQLRTQRQIRRVMEEGVEAGEAVETEGIERLARIRHLYDLLLALITLGLIAYGILVLLLRMRWEW